MMSMSMFLEKRRKPEEEIHIPKLLLPFGFQVKTFQSVISVKMNLVCLKENITVGFVVGFLCELC